MANKNNELFEDNNLDFNDAKNMTVEEALRKESEIKAGINENDNVLDKYIKQHREEVGKHKFESTLHTKETDIDESLQESDGGAEQSRESEFPKEKVVFDQIDDVPLKSEELDDIILGDRKSSKKGFIIAGLMALVVLIVALAVILHNFNSDSNTNQTTIVKKESTNATKDEVKSKDFDKLYSGFFVDDEMTKLKNSEFDRLSELEVELKKLDGTSSYQNAKEKYDALKKSIDAIKTINEQFVTPTIVDGEVRQATIKDSANFDAISSSELNTGKANLDTILQTVVSNGRKQLSEKNQNDSNSLVNASPAEKSNQTVVENQQNATTSLPQVPAVNDNQVANSIPNQYGIINYDPAILQRQLSRVPYNNDMIADTNNPAWLFNNGIIEKIIAIAQQRGHISGNNYILERVNIINGNGYYNMFKPDGTYLFSINAKTGYFVGNAPGRSDALDY